MSLLRFCISSPKHLTYMNDLNCFLYDNGEVKNAGQTKILEVVACVISFWLEFCVERLSNFAGGHEMFEWQFDSVAQDYYRLCSNVKPKLTVVVL